MKNLIVILIASLSIIMSGCTSKEINDALNTAGQLLNQSGNSSIAPTQMEAASGIKEALSNGVTKGTQALSKPDGFFKNLAIKLLMPPEAQKVEKTLRDMGMNKLVDDAIMSMNRAAEDASSKALPIFKNAITTMSITDAINIIKGPNDACTSYLKNKTTEQLKTAFNPVVKASLDKVGATKYWNDVFSTYNKIPMVNKVNPDLTDYVTTKAIDGVFVQIKNEEANIRNNPVARTTELLKKVFGWASANKK